MFGLKPWDVDEENPGCLTWGEVQVYQLALRDHVEASERARAEMDALRAQRR